MLQAFARPVSIFSNFLLIMIMIMKFLNLLFSVFMNQTWDRVKREWLKKHVYIRTGWAVIAALRSDDDVVDGDVAEHVLTSNSNKHNLRKDNKDIHTMYKPVTHLTHMYTAVSTVQRKPCSGVTRNLSWGGIKFAWPDFKDIHRYHCRFDGPDHTVRLSDAVVATDVIVRNAVISTDRLDN